MVGGDGAGDGREEKSGTEAALSRLEDWRGDDMMERRRDHEESREPGDVDREAVAVAKFQNVDGGGVIEGASNVVLRSVVEKHNGRAPPCQFKTKGTLTFSGSSDVVVSMVHVAMPY